MGNSRWAFQLNAKEKLEYLLIFIEASWKIQTKFQSRSKPSEIFETRKEVICECYCLRLWLLYRLLWSLVLTIGTKGGTLAPPLPPPPKSATENQYYYRYEVDNYCYNQYFRKSLHKWADQLDS